MALKLPDVFRQTRADTWTTRAGNAALLRIYSGSQPADADTAASGTLLAELTCGTPFAPAASSEGVLTLGAITQDPLANAAGTAGWFRVVKADGTTCVCDGTVTVTGGGGQLELVTVTIALNQPVQVSSFVITEGGA